MNKKGLTIITTTFVLILLIGGISLFVIRNISSSPPQAFEFRSPDCRLESFNETCNFNQTILINNITIKREMVTIENITIDWIEENSECKLLQENNWACNKYLVTLVKK